MDNDIIPPDGKVTCKVCGGDVRTVARFQKVWQRFITLSIPCYRHKMIADELKEKFNIDCEQKRNAFFAFIVGNALCAKEFVDQSSGIAELTERYGRLIEDLLEGLEKNSKTLAKGLANALPEAKELLEKKTKEQKSS